MPARNVKIHVANREKIVAGLESRLDLQRWREALLSTADAIDAVVCALAAAAVTLKKSGTVPDVNVADREGWIAISKWAAFGALCPSILKFVEILCLYHRLTEKA